MKTIHLLKYLIYLLLFNTNLTFAQTVKLSEADVEDYARVIDSLRKENKLVKISYPEMSHCGGAIDGYFLNRQLILIDATYSGENGFSSRIIYLQNEIPLKIIYREHFADWEKYERQFPLDRFEYDASKMIYYDTVYTFILSHRLKIYRNPGKDFAVSDFEVSLLNDLIKCMARMESEIQSVVGQLNSLQFVKEMPYICGLSLCGDNVYWQVVGLRESGIELLIDKMDDTTLTTATVPLFGGNYTVADVTYSALREIIHDIPTFDLLGVPFDTVGCGYCSYWQHLRSDYKHRTGFKTAVRNWYIMNKEKLVWVGSNSFNGCDCRGVHPNGGHYKLNSAEK